MADKKKLLSTETVTKVSLWTSAPTEPVTMPWIHLVALTFYAVGMLAYIVLASIQWATFERPVNFEAQETRVYKPVPLNFSIDCQDCRRFPDRRPDSSLWRLSWDYSTLSGGCAARSPTLFDDELRAFCARQHTASPTREYYPLPFSMCTDPGGPRTPDNSFTSLNFTSLFTYTSDMSSMTGTVADCQARCDAAADCASFTFNLNNGLCLVHPSSRRCRWVTHYDTVAWPFLTYLLKTSDPPSEPLADALDKCTITSNDVEILRQRASPNPQTATMVNVSYHLGNAWNPNYIAERPWPNYTNCGWGPCFFFGPATPDRGKGSFYELAHTIPLCHVRGGGALQLEVENIPHHSFAGDGIPIGQAVVTLSSGTTFRQENAFQPWHKNTIHLGLTVERDENEVIKKADPFFTNFQYDGRVDWGKEEAQMPGEIAEQVARMQLAMGPNYNGITLDEALILDMCAFLGLIQVGVTSSLNSSQIESLRQAASCGPGCLYFLRSEHAWRMNAEKSPRGDASDVYSRGRRMRTRPNVDKEVTQGEGSPRRRRLNHHDEWGGVLLTIKLGRFANVYTDGHKPTVYDVIASVGGASGSLIGLIGLGVVVLEASVALWSKLSTMRGSRSVVPTDVEKKAARTSSEP